MPVRGKTSSKATKSTGRGKSVARKTSSAKTTSKPVQKTAKKTARGKVPKKTVSKKAASKKPVSKKTAAKAVKPAKKTAPKPVKPQKTEVKKAPSKKSRAEDERREALRKLLISKREQIVSEAKTEITRYIKGENRQLVETALDGGDWSVVDLSEDVMFRKLGMHKEMLFKIDESLRKLKEETYGVCEDCGEEISPERLKVLPFAILCRDCQEDRELWEAMEKSSGI